MCMDQKTQYCLNTNFPQTDVYSQCNPREIPKLIIKSKRIRIAKAILKQKVWRFHNIWPQDLESYNNQDSALLKEGETCT